MALIKCPECNKEISDKAESCPHCGYPIKHNNEVHQEKVETYSLKLMNTSQKVKAIKIIRELFGYGLKEAKDLADQAPITLAKGLPKDEVTRMAQPFYNNLINVEICNDGNNPIDFNLKPQPPKNQYDSNEPLQSYSSNSINANQPKCPTCSSTNIQKISLTQKAVGAMFGLFSSKIRNTFECKSCGYKW